jgi:hypothetical protein
MVDGNFALLVSEIIIQMQDQWCACPAQGRRVKTVRTKSRVMSSNLDRNV